MLYVCFLLLFEINLSNGLKREQNSIMKFD